MDESKLNKSKNPQNQKEKLLTYGVFENELTYISIVENGLACNCICAKCNQPLVAKNNPNNIKQAHFAHYSELDCEGAYETTLHLLAKEVFQTSKIMTTPNFHHDYDNFNTSSIFRKSQEIEFDDVLLEKEIKQNDIEIKPDAIGIKKGSKICIEFAYSHFVDDEKKEKLNKLGLPCIEIDLREVEMNISAIKKLFNSNTHLKYWISNPKLDKKYELFVIKKEEEEREREIQEANFNKKKKSEFFEKMQSFKNDGYHVAKITNGFTFNCPKKNEFLEKFKDKNKNFYSHELLKSIINGEFWNGKTYGQKPNGSWIFLKGEKVIVYPSLWRIRELSMKEQKDYNLLWAGLMSISEIFEKNDVGNCGFCDSYNGRITDDGKEYTVCSYIRERNNKSS